MRLNLKCHPDASTDIVSAIDVELDLSSTGVLSLQYEVSAEVNAIDFLDVSEPGRADYLWQHSCFEAFIKPAGGGSYLEFNLSPSTEWAVYAFEDHRKGMTDVELNTDPMVQGSFVETGYQLSAQLDLSAQAMFEDGRIAFLGLSAIIEEKSGHKSLWALTHPTGNPDFHHWDCFAHELKAPKGL